MQIYSCPACGGVLGKGGAWLLRMGQEVLEPPFREVVELSRLRRCAWQGRRMTFAHGTGSPGASV